VNDDPITRRRALGWFGAAGVAALAAACSKGSSTNSAASTTTTSPLLASRPTTTLQNSNDGTAVAPACVLSPEMTEGPYYIPDEAVRSDITEGKPGTPLHLVLTVVDAGTCQPIQGASVDVWHADAVGEYSGFGNSQGNRTFLRGVQSTDGQGKAEFRTIYPGWYQGRATHIHLKVHAGGAVVHTGQLFFDDKTNDAVYATAPYNTHTGSRTTNSQDGIYRNGGAQSMPALSQEGAGYLATITLGVQSQSAASAA
jgi:protocatechuate 3,4-dioxygenase beta subunit